MACWWAEAVVPLASSSAYAGLYVWSVLLRGMGAVWTLWRRAPEAQRQAAMVSQAVRI
jgi:hypothetical protein